MARAVLTRFELAVLRDKTGSDNTQVPADGASINFYRQGATVQTTVTIQPGSFGGTIAVLYAGQVEAGDVLRVGTTTDRLTVVQVASATQLLVRWAGSSPYTVLQGTRLWIVNGRPVAFADSAGTMAVGSSIPVESGTGFAATYLSVDRFDFEVLIPGQATRYYLDQAASFGRSDQLWNDIRDFGGSIQAALDALPPTGGVVFVPRGTWVLSAGITIGKPNVSIAGERALSVIRPSSANVFDLLNITEARCRLRDLVLDGADSAHRTNGKSCAVVSAQATTFERVLVRKAPQHGVWIKDAQGFLAEQCNFDGNWGSGVRAETVSGEALNVGFVACSFNQNQSRGCEVDHVSGLRFLGCTFDGNRGGTGEFEGNALEVIDSRAPQVISSAFRNADTSTRAANFVSLSQCLSPQVDGCCFDGGATDAKRPTQGVVFDHSPGFRLNNCLGKQLKDYLARFQADSLDGMEFCNAESEALAADTLVRLRCDVGRMTSLSRRTLSVPILGSESERPTGAATPGTMVWVNGTLEVWSGTGWVSAQLVS